MVVPGFGLSARDFITGTTLLVNLLGGFKEKGGASAKYASESSFLTSLVATLQHLEDYVATDPQDAVSQDIVKLLKIVEGPLNEFKSFLDKYQSSLGQDSTVSSIRKSKATTSFTINDISGKVDKLRRQIEQPLEAVNSLLSLQLMYIWPL
jgi:hypothetical protein